MRLVKNLMQRGVGVLAALLVVAGASPAQDLAQQAWELERSGQAADAERRLRQAVEDAPSDPNALRPLAEFLERHRNPDARGVYSRLADALGAAGGAEQQAVLRRLAALDLRAGDRAAAARHIEAYTAAGGSGLSLPTARDAQPTDFLEIPGPLEGFSRMAAVSPDLAPEDFMPALARNVVLNGYRAYSANDALEQTEYLSLLMRYLTQARELERLAGPEQVIRIEQCESSDTAALLRVIGYRMRGACGGEVVLETINASRAFLTTDSGFPLGQLELALRTNRPFELDYHPTRIPILYTRDYWQPVEDQEDEEFLDYFLSDPSLSRLYVGLSKLDSETAEALRQRVPSPRLKLYAHVLDFFGGMFQIRGGRAIVPGAPQTGNVWKDLNGGVDPDKGAEFFERLLITDDGWLASYYDAVARVNGPLAGYLLDPDRLERYYEAIRGKVTTPGPARPVFRSNTDMLLLTARLRLDPDGTPHLPGGLEVWKQLFQDEPKDVKIDGKIRKAARGWRDADDVVEAMFGLTRKMAENEILKIFMAISDMDRHRNEPLSAEVVALLADNYEEMSSQYPLFAEVPTVSNATIASFLEVAKEVGDIGNQTRRADAAGTLQGLVGLWQIFVRDGMIPTDRADATLASIIAPFIDIGNHRELFDAGRAGVETLMAATLSPEGDSLQDRMLDLLAGTAAPAGTSAYRSLVQDLIRVFQAQRLVQLDTLFELADQMGTLKRGEPFDAALAGRLANRIVEIPLPDADLTRAERSASAFGYWSAQHIDDQRKRNLRRDIEKKADDPDDLWDLRGELAPYLRDTLVGLNYMHYAPPGAQILLTNPMFVRNHDFLGTRGAQQTWQPTSIFGQGWPRNAGGRLVGSLASLPYALAEAEQNFLVPTREQALIWGDLVPQMMLTAVIPRWWNVTPAQIHWVGLHMSYAEALLGDAALKADSRARILEALRPLMSPRRLESVDLALQAGEVDTAVKDVMPSEMYRLARQLADQDQESRLAADIRRLAAEAPEDTSEAAISRAFGTPKPTLANSYQPELLNLRTFPTLMGYSSRILAESWESNLLYFAALADEIHAHPRDLNVLVPQWTQRTAERIFATHLEDWPALLRSLRAVGEDVLAEARARVQAGLTIGGQGQ